MNEDMSDIMNKIKNIMNSSNSNNNNSEEVAEADKSSSISPETISNLMSMLNLSNNNSKTNDNSKEKSNNGSSYTSSENASSQIPNFDFETILKLKNVMEKMNNKNDPRSNLLLSLKPYLKESRKSKVDQYVQLLNISSAFDIFKASGGENKK